MKSKIIEFQALSLKNNSTYSLKKVDLGASETLRLVICMESYFRTKRQKSLSLISWNAAMWWPLMQLTLGMLLPPRYSMLLLLGMLLSLAMLLPSGHAASPGHAVLPGACWSILMTKRHFYIIFYGVSRYTH
jgi:hypothetical protein